MCEYVCNNFYASGSIGDIHALKKALLKIDDATGYAMDFSLLRPIPKGVENPTDWCLQNWGTRENAIEVSFEDWPVMTASESFICSFDTANFAPIPLFQELVTRFPKVSIKVAYLHSSDEFLGIFLGQNGVFAYSEYLPASAEFSKFAALEFFLD